MKEILQNNEKTPELSESEKEQIEEDVREITGIEERRYVSENLKTPDRFISIAGPNTSAYVGVTFEISKEGKANNIFLYHSAEWSADNEAIRVLLNSPKWKPAEKNGNPTVYSFRQKLIFSVAN